MKIGIVFGGVSYEHEISIISAITMATVIKEELVFIFCDENRDFYHIANSSMKAKLFSSGDYKKCDSLNLKKSTFVKKSMFGEKNLEVDVLLNLAHGADGEDGLFSSLFDFYDISYIGPRREACAVSFNKFLTKGYASSLGVKTIDYNYYAKGDDVNVNEFPLIVKPVTLGSSIGVSIVKNKEELAYALDVAYEFDTALITETFIPSVKEYNLAGSKINDEFVFSIVEEPQKTEFLDFDKKYLDFARSSTAAKADISEALEEKLKNTFKKVYNTLFDGSLIRCDFFVIDDEVYLNEINPIPGSMSNYLFSDFNKVISSLASALPRKHKINVTYEYVNKINAAKGK